MNDQLPTLLEALDEFRLAQGWSQNQMAKQLGLHNSHYSEFVHGKRKLPQRALKKAFAMGLDPKVLLQPEETAV